VVPGEMARQSANCTAFTLRTPLPPLLPHTRLARIVVCYTHMLCAPSPAVTIDLCACQLYQHTKKKKEGGRRGRSL